jgi:hypothetical protein
LIDKCDVLMAFAKWLPDKVKDETLLTFESDEEFRKIMGSHLTKWQRYRKNNGRSLEEAQELKDKGPSNSEDEKESIVEIEANRTPSPVKQGAELSVKEEEELSIDLAMLRELELSIEETIEEAKEQNQEPQLLQSQDQKPKEQDQGQQPPLLEEAKPPARANPAKRNLSSSDDSDAGNGKPDMQRMKGEHGAVVRTKTMRSNRWGATHKSSGKEESQSSSTDIAFGMAKVLAADQQQATSGRGVSNNLRGTHDPELGFGGKVKSQESIKKDIFRSADSLRLPKGQESLVFHRGNFMDHNAVIHSASAYADFIIEDACTRGIPEVQRIIIRGKDRRNIDGIPDNKTKQCAKGQSVVNASYAHMGRQSDEDLKEIQEELETVMADLQRDPTKMTQFRGWSSRNAGRSKEARERCFHWSAPGTQQLPRLPYSDKLHKLSARLDKFLQVGGRLHYDCVARSYIPPGFVYQLWLDNVKKYREDRTQLLKARATESSFQLLRRVPHNTPSTVSSTVNVKNESAITGGRPMAMLMGTPEVKMTDLKKAKGCCNELEW